MANEYINIPKEKFEFANSDAKLHDEKLQTKARGYFADAFRRFRKNKSSVVAAWIILFLIIFAIVAPMISSFDIEDKDDVFRNFPPFVPAIADLGLGILDGSKTVDDYNELEMQILAGIAAETGCDPVIDASNVEEWSVIEKGKPVTKKSYVNVEVNAYYMKGIRFINISREEFLAIQEWQNEHQIQVIYPYVFQQDVFEGVKGILPKEDASVWYKCKDTKFNARYDDNGEFIPAYCTDQTKASKIPYDSLRIEGDEGDLVYAIDKGSAVRVRVFHYTYYQFKNNTTPNFFFGTDDFGRDLFCAIGMGARFSLLFAVLVSAVNLTIGAFYGAVQGYYGGWLDLLLDRISDILSGMPFMVVITLFQLHLAPKLGEYGALVAFFLAFIATGWIGMAALTRKQFYRFKSSEYVMAAKTLGARDGRVMFKHIFPNAIGTMVTSCALVIPGVISSETSLTYLKIIDLAQFTGTSIGQLMSQGQATGLDSPHTMLFPALFVSLLLISFNLFGNGLRDAFNPSTRGEE